MSALDTEVDLVLLIGAAHVPACEHPEHGNPQHTTHSDGNEHYVRFLTDCGHIRPTIKVVCGSWLARVTDAWCIPCDRHWPRDEVIFDLGPVSTYTP
jgi:hypothetical protein